MPLTKVKAEMLDVDKDISINGAISGTGTGADNLRFGKLALTSNTTGTDNTAIGANALTDNTVGEQNTAIGSNALAINTDGDLNTAIGKMALFQNTSGSYNTAVGVNSLYNNTTGYDNVAIGVNALNQNTSGYKNFAIGPTSLYSNTSGHNNIGVGINALNDNTNGTRNVAIGHFSLKSNGSGEYNTAVGWNTLYHNTGYDNTAVGASALTNNTIGNDNTAIGVNALFNNVSWENTSGVGQNAQVTGSNQVQLGDSATTTYAYGTVQNRSDERDKTDIRDTELGLEFVKALRPVDFKWDMREDYRPEPPELPNENATDEEKSAYDTAKAQWIEDVKLANITRDGSKKRNRFHHGLIAQEVKAVLDDKGIDFGGFQDHKIAGGDDVLSIGYDELIAPMIKAIQELSAEVASLKAELNK